MLVRLLKDVETENGFMLAGNTLDRPDAYLLFPHGLAEPADAQAQEYWDLWRAEVAAREAKRRPPAPVAPTIAPVVVPAPHVEPAPQQPEPVADTHAEETHHDDHA